MQCPSNRHARYGVARAAEKGHPAKRASQTDGHHMPKGTRGPPASQTDGHAHRAHRPEHVRDDHARDCQRHVGCRKRPDRGRQRRQAHHL
eukprot:363429-Chlamydomonas_euryale.AAC.26